MARASFDDIFSELNLPPSALPVADGGGYAASGTGSAGSGSWGAPGPSSGSALPLAPLSGGGSGSDGDIDAILGLINAHEGLGGGPGGEAGRGAEGSSADVDDVLGLLVPGTGSPLQLARTSPLLSPLLAPLDSVAKMDTLEPINSLVTASSDLVPDWDLPEPTLALPGDIIPKAFTMTAKFNLKCPVELKTLSFGLKHCEYNPRKHGSVTVRLFDPRATAIVSPSGTVTMIAGNLDEESLKHCAKKIARLVQRVNHPQAKFAGFHITSIVAKAVLGFPIRIDALAAKWRRNAMYEPEIYCHCVFRIARPRCAFLITIGGKVIITGLRRRSDIDEALRRIYPLCKEFGS